jgi:hypothetical protein
MSDVSTDGLLADRCFPTDARRSRGSDALGTYTFFDSDGNPKDSGVYEEWWFSDQK